MVTRDEELKWAYLLDPCFELINTAGKPLTDGYIEVYIAGTRNKYYCASDFAGTLHPFQIPLDSLGSNIVLANPDNAYDVYVYNRYGNLVMSRYNVTPADGGAVISNTERINDLEELVVSAVTGLQGQIDDINETLENKKDKQEPYSVTLTPTQTVSAIIQNENGEMEVIYQEIDLPEEVPNVDIVSPASTLNITTHIDEETNTKTFSIDLSDLGHLEYGQYMATEDVITGANMYRIKGNLDTTLDGKIQLHKGNSYHITVRGSYVCTDINNSINTLDYIEYSTFTPFHVDVDNTITDPQNFEISYDIFKLSNDTNYYIAFAASAGKVSNLTVEIHSLSNLSILDPDFKYQEGWGINIVSSVISVDPDIFNDYTTHTDVYESIVTAIDFVTGAMPAGQIQSDWNETDDTQPSYIQNKPDLDIYATHDEVNTVSGQIIETVNNVSSVLHEEITNNNDTVIETINNVSGILHEEIIETAQVITGLIPDVSDFTTHEDVNSAIVTAIEYVTGIIPDAQVQSDWDQSDDTQPDYIKNKPDLDIYATHDEVNTVSGQIIEVVNNVSGDIIETVNNVSGDIIETVNNVSGILHSEIENIPEQQQADWDQADDTQVDYIKNKPDLSIYATHDEVVDAVTSIDLSEYATHTEVYDSSVTAIQLVTGLIPDVSDFTTHEDVHESIVSALEYVTGIIPDAQVQSDWTEDDTEDPAYIQNKPDQIELVAGQNIGIFDDGSTLAIAASGTDLTGYATDAEVSQAIASSITDFVTNSEVSSAIVTAIEYVTGIIPDAQVQSNWTEADTSDPSYIQNKPQEYDIIAGDNIGISVEGNFVTISASGISAEEVIEIVSSVTGLAEYGQFYASSVYGHATMSRTKGTIETTQYGDIKLKKGTSYHVTVRGRYNQTTPSNVYGNISYVEYITGGNININVDKSITESQYFEISYDLYKLNSDTDYQVSFSGISNAAVNDLYIEIHALGGIGGNGSVTGATEYDAGWGIQILNNVISVNPSIIPDIAPLATKSELQDSVELVTGLIPDTSDMATQTWVNNQGFLTSIPDTYATDTEVYEAIASSVTGFVTESQVTALIPDSEEVQFEELDITQFAQASAIPIVTGFATKSELSDVESTIPTVQLNGDDQVIAINNHEIAGTGGTTYTAGDYISIENDEISVTGLEPLPEIVEMDALEIKAGTNIAIVTGVSDITISVTGIEIPDTSDMATKTWVGNQGYLTSIPDTYATDIEVSQAIASSVTGFLTEPEVTALIPESEEVQFEELDITQFAQASAIPDVSSYATHTEVYNAIVTGVQVATGLIPDVSDMATQTWVGNQGYLTEIPNTYATDIEVSQAIASSVTGFLTEPQVTALIPESEDVTFEEINIANYALASAIPDVSNFVTDTEVTTEITEAVSGKQDLLTGITDVQVVTGLPVSLTQDVLYLIVEA